MEAPTDQIMEASWLIYWCYSILYYEMLVLRLRKTSIGDTNLRPMFMEIQRSRESYIHSICGRRFLKMIIRDWSSTTTRSSSSRQLSIHRQQLIVKACSAQWSTLKVTWEESLTTDTLDQLTRLSMVAGKIQFYLWNPELTHNRWWLSDQKGRSPYVLQPYGWGW